MANPLPAGADAEGPKSLSAPLAPVQLRFLRARCTVKTGQGSDVCAICLEALRPSSSEQCVKLPCGGEHVFHFACVEPWFKKCSLCPKCRQPLQIHLPARARSSVGSGGRMTQIDREVQMAAMPFASMEEEMAALGLGGGSRLDVAARAPSDAPSMWQQAAMVRPPRIPSRVR